MSFPIQFSKPSGAYDFMSGPINIAGNGAVVMIGSISVGLVTDVALKALGYHGIRSLATTVFITSAGVSGLVALGGLAFYGYILCSVASAFRK
jgi:hypothetical protein